MIVVVVPQGDLIFRFSEENPNSKCLFFFNFLKVSFWKMVQLLIDEINERKRKKLSPGEIIFNVNRLTFTMAYLTFSLVSFLTLLQF